MLPRSVARSCLLVALASLLTLTALAQEVYTSAGPEGIEASTATESTGSTDSAESVSSSGLAESAVSATQVSDPAGTLPEQDDLLLATLAQDIAGSDYYALVAWAKSLGLATSGSASELRTRLYTYYEVQAPAPVAPSARLITIQSADRTEYISAEGEGNSFIRLSGRVSVLLEDSEAGEKLSIEADELLVNRDASILSARGNVSFERNRPDGTDYFFGQAMELDMDDWAGVFLDGKSVRGDSTTNTMVFKARDIIRRGGNVLIFDDGEITSCDEEFAHFSIRASTIWILGVNEWAMANATLSVGEVPLLYLPVFFYPGEEIVFHPVFGYRDRDGRLVQTTTYFLGEKKAKEESISLFKLTEGGGAYERVVEGVFLRTTDRKKATTSPDFFKLMVDVYSNLGVFSGAQGSLGSLGPLKDSTAFAGLGISRSVFAAPDGLYSPYILATDYTSVWNQSDFMTLELPWRYGFEFTSRLDLGPLTLNLALPLFSDPFFQQDFLNRSEDMDWLRFLKQEENPSPPAKRTSFVDKIEGKLSAPASMLPWWLSSLSLSRIGTSLSWASKEKQPRPLAGTTEGTLFSVDPAREFFYPEQWTVVDAAASFGGTLFRYPPSPATVAAVVTQSASTAPEQASADQAAAVDPLAELIAAEPEMEKPWTVDPAPSRAGTGPANGFTAPALLSPEKLDTSVPLTASLSWQLAPTFLWDRRFDTSTWYEPADIDFSEALYELRSLRSTGSLTLKADAYGGLVGFDGVLSGLSQFQERPIANATTTSLLDSWLLQDARYRTDKLSGTMKLTGSPFKDSWLWSPTSLSYNLNATLYEYAFVAMAGDDPHYEERWLEWNAQRISTHNFSLVAGIRPLGISQTLTLQADLPPLTEGYSAKLNLKAPQAGFSVQTRYARPVADAGFLWSPLTMSANLGLDPWPVLTGNLSWSLEDEQAETASAKLVWSGLSVELAARRAALLDFIDEGTGFAWVAVSDETFRLSNFHASYKNSWKPPPIWKNRLAWTLDLGLDAQQSLVRFSDSSMDLTFGFTFKVHEFIDVKIESVSRNAALWRYYPGLFGLDPDLFPPVNPVEDILRSFNFFESSETDRRESLFKLKSLSASMVHDLHDWDLTASLSLAPELDSETSEYYFKPFFSILLAWRAVPEFKSSYKLDGEVEEW
ncbi:MAG: hypothetical protein AB7T74_12445 [Clostridia bacterium]